MLIGKVRQRHRPRQSVAHYDGCLSGRPSTAGQALTGWSLMLTLVPLMSTFTGPDEPAGLGAWAGAAGAGLAWRMVMVTFCTAGLAAAGLPAGGLGAGLEGGGAADLGAGAAAGTLTCKNRR